MVTLPSLANIGGLMLLLVLIYAILGVYLFSPVKLSGGLDHHANFQSINQAFITLIRVLTGERWPKLLEALSRGKDIGFECITNPTYSDYQANGYETIGCGDPLFATAYFYSFTLIIGMVFLRLFIAIVLQAFQETSEHNSKFMNSDLTNRFRDIWAQFDPDATSFIKITSYPRFLVQLGEPLGWDLSYDHDYVKQSHYLNEVNLPKYNRQNQYQFMDVFDNLVTIMIVRREVIHFAIKNKLPRLLGKDDYLL